ncbi:hypothetical protein [Flavobacterium piscis]|uniref:Regulator of replication initiation timing n=1 Tax=Flavobacterium piscis TaxID=1114874 RepID=A0ABU1Y2N3_9FLAO|nr:hypothetical protein [Flavobacterium piscis]MDR7208478.1 regulator of replication initiation timing [Flavobacterium piscis]
MKKQSQNKWLGALLAVLFISGIGTSVYIFSSESNDLRGNSGPLQKTTFNNSDNLESLSKKNILDSLNVLKSAYDTVLLEKTYLSQELELEKKNVERLIDIINASKTPTSSEINVYRKQLSDLKLSLDTKIQEINKLRSQNKSLLTKIENQNEVMYQQKVKNDTLVSHQKKLESTLKSASKLELNNFKVIALREKKSGEELETDKAKNTDKLKVSFTISGNSVAKTGKKVFYVQVLDQKNTVLGEDKLIEFGNNKALVYSFIVAIDFQGNAVNVYGILNSDGNEFQKGIYFVNFFDKQELVGSTYIILK